MADPITKSVVGIAGSVLNKFVADKNLKMQLEHELKTQLQTANLAQIEVNKIEQRLEEVEAQADVNSNTGRFIERFMWIIVAASIGLIAYFLRIGG